MSEGGTAGHAERMTQAERDERSRQRRTEVLALPMTPLRLHGHLDRHGQPRGPAAVGVGPDEVAVAAWPPSMGEHGVVVTSQNGKGRLFSKERYRSQILPRVAVLEVPTPLAVTHVQPLPGGKVLVVCARTPGADTAEVWDGNGHLEHAGLIGDAIEHLLSTPSGAIWTGYFDEGSSERCPAPTASSGSPQVRQSQVLGCLDSLRSRHGWGSITWTFCT
jgi:hypothetical protein